MLNGKKLIMLNLRKFIIFFRNIEIISNLKEISRISSHIRLDMLRNILNMDVKYFIIKILEWSNTFGFKIEGNYIYFQEEKTLDKLIDKLDEKFAQWGKKEENGYEKSDFKVNINIPYFPEKDISRENNEIEFFTLIKKLLDLGDMDAKKALQDQIIIEIKKKNVQTIDFLINNSYLEYLDTHDLLEILKISQSRKILVSFFLYKFFSDLFGLSTEIQSKPLLFLDSLNEKDVEILYEKIIYFLGKSPNSALILKKLMSGALSKIFNLNNNISITETNKILKEIIENEEFINFIQDLYLEKLI